MIPGTKSTVRMLASAAETEGLAFRSSVWTALSRTHQASTTTTMPTMCPCAQKATSRCGLPIGGKILGPGDFCYAPRKAIHQPQLLDDGVIETIRLNKPG